MEGANKSMEHFDTCSPTLGFLIKKNKSVLLPCQILQFVGGEIHSKEMSVPLPQQKKVKIVSQCSGKRLTKVLCPLSFTIVAVLVASIRYREIQRQQIAELFNTQNFDLMIEEARKELQC